MNFYRLVVIGAPAVLAGCLAVSCTQKTDSMNGRSKVANQQGGQQVQNAPNTNFQYLTASTFAELPTCKDEINGSIYYIFAESKFYICDAANATWVHKDLTGAAGEAGINSLIEQQVLAAGDANCVNGGVAFISYLDKDKTGSFTQGDENIQMSYMCNGATSDDTDGDTIKNNVDNCPTVANLDQKDTDGDKIGDACDPAPTVPNQAINDQDGDLVPDELDNCPVNPNPRQKDVNANGVGDICDPKLLFDNFIQLILHNACTECNLQSLYVRGRNFTKPLLSGSNMQKINMRNAEVEFGDFSNADARNANFLTLHAKGATFAKANLSGASLKQADLTSANLTFANLTGADLTEADLKNADLTGAILKDADFRAANMVGVKGFDKATCGCKY